MEVPSTMLYTGLSPSDSPKDTRNSCGLRFFDLPTELRESVYKYISTSWPNQKIDLNDYSVETIGAEANIFPTLLSASKRLTNEAGPYFFFAKEFDITIRQPDIDTFAVWLRSIGKVNRILLLSNSKVKIRLVHEHKLCKERCSGLSEGDTSVLTGSDFVKLVNSYELYRRSDAPVALSLAQWSFTCGCTDVVSGSLQWPTVDNIVDYYSSAKTIPPRKKSEHPGVSILELLLESIFAVHGNRGVHRIEG